METLYLLNKTAKFKGHCIDSISECNFDKDDFDKSILDYSSGKTFEQQNILEDGNLIALTWDDFCDLYLRPYIKGLQEPFKEITYDRWKDMLNCLPPMKWHNMPDGKNYSLNVFFISEAYTHNLHSCFIHDIKNNKYYEALRPINSTDEQLLIDFNNK